MGFNETKLDPYEAAFLKGGAPTANRAAIAALAHAEIFGVADRTVSKNAVPDDDVLPFERAVYDACGPGGGTAIQWFPLKTRGAVRELKGRVRLRGPTVGPIAAAFLWLAPVVLLLGLAWFGILRIELGLSRNRPVSYLALLVLLVFIFVAVAFWSRGPFLTARGKKALETTMTLNQAMRTQAQEKPDELSGRDIGYVVGLFGVAGVNSDPIRRLWPPPAPGNSGGWGSFSSCGGGGGCGGGGCGGGGCGG